MLRVMRDRARTQRGLAWACALAAGLLLGDGVFGRTLVLLQLVDGPHHASLRFERDHFDLWLAHEHPGCETQAPEPEPPRPALAGDDHALPGHLVQLCQEDRPDAAPSASGALSVAVAAPLPPEPALEPAPPVRPALSCDRLQRPVRADRTTVLRV